MNADKHRSDLAIWRSGDLAIFLCIIICFHLHPSATVLAQDAEPQGADVPSVDDLLKIPKAAPKKPERAPLDRPVAEELSTEPFKLAVEGMKDAATRLGDQQDPGIETQRVQEQVVKRLDMLISQLRRQQMRQQQGKPREKDSGSQKQRDQQQEQSNEESNQAATGESDPNAVNLEKPKTEQESDAPLAESFEEWGKLPPRVRDALRNYNAEKVSSLYKSLTERYYQRLAEESNP